MNCTWYHLVENWYQSDTWGGRYAESRSFPMFFDRVQYSNPVTPTLIRCRKSAWLLGLQFSYRTNDPTFLVKIWLRKFTFVKYPESFFFVDSGVVILPRNLRRVTEQLWRKGTGQYDALCHWLSCPAPNHFWTGSNLYPCNNALMRSEAKSPTS